MKAAANGFRTKAMEKKMTEITLPLNTTYKNRKSAAAGSGKTPTTWNFTALLGFTGGISFAIIGLFMNFVGYFFENGNVSSEMSKIGTALICISFPLTLLGAHALDKISENKRKHAVERTAYKKIK